MIYLRIARLTLTAPLWLPLVLILYGLALGVGVVLEVWRGWPWVDTGSGS